jgi:hypothetical protein
MWFLLLLFTIFLGATGNASKFVDKVNHEFGTHMSGLAMYITALVVCLILDAMFSRD